MSTLKVTVEKLVIEPHPNADLLELAQVGLYNAVVLKDQFKTGDYAIYIPEAAIVPDELIEELGLTGKLAGKAKNRVKAVRLRGALSQGIVCRPKALNGTDFTSDPHPGFNYAELLGITKWVPEIPAHMSGAVISAPELIRWPDIENLKRYPDIFTSGEQVVATEKIHGTCCLMTYAEGDRFFVSSKGFGEKSLALEENSSNLYWRAAQQYNLREQLSCIAIDYDLIAVGLFGEVYGQGVQDLGYGKAAGRNETLGFVAFDIAGVDADGGKRWLNADDFASIAAEHGIPTAPVLYRGPFDLEALNEVVSGPTVLGEGVHIREGIVIRPETEARSDVLGGRKIAKLVSDEYLLRKNATEFE